MWHFDFHYIDEIISRFLNHYNINKAIIYSLLVNYIPSVYYEFLQS